jgi:hypothetical protein
MEYPPEWIFLSPEEAASLNFNPNRPLSMTVLLDFSDGAAGAFRQILGGTEILEVVFPADVLFGPEFSGKSTLLFLVYSPSPPPPVCLSPTVFIFILFLSLFLFLIRFSSVLLVSDTASALPRSYASPRLAGNFSFRFALIQHQ